MWNEFEKDLSGIKLQCKAHHWNADSGLDGVELFRECDKLAEEMKDRPKISVKAYLFDFILRNAQIEIDSWDWFPDQIRHDFVLDRIRRKWINSIFSTDLSALLAEHKYHADSLAYTGEVDFGHTMPDWETLFKIGVPGLIKRIREAKQSPGISEEQKLFYEAAETVCNATIVFIGRLADLAAKEADSNEKMALVSRSLYNLTVGAPQSMLEAMQLTFIYYNLQNNIERTNVRSMGGPDRLYYSFYKNDIASGAYSETQLRELIRYFLMKFNAKEVTANIPFFLGGIDSEGNDATNELSGIIVEEYTKLDILDPKIHIRYHDKMSKDFLVKVLDAIRQGKNSFVFINNSVVEKALIALGEKPEDARNFTVIGCYEPCAAGKEVPCTCNGRISLPKVVELALNDGVDPLTGNRLAPAFNAKELTFDTFYGYVKTIAAYFAQRVITLVSTLETRYPDMNPSPLFSATFSDCVLNGKDAYSGGARYNNSSINVFGLASAVDSLVAIKKMVFEEKKMSLAELAQVLRRDWSGHEDMRLAAKKTYPKYGNNVEEVDRIAVDLAGYVASRINKKPNGRGGIFRCGMFSIDWWMPFGQKTGATPDGRHSGEGISKNMCAAIGCDKKGVTALINSVTKIDYTKVPNGTVLDLMLHPSAANDEEGMTAMRGLLETYMQEGGFALQFNVLDVETLKAAQNNPEKYSNLQVRLCGWNVYFNNLSKEEQNAFIKQAECLQN